MKRIRASDRQELGILPPPSPRKKSLPRASTLCAALVCAFLAVGQPARAGIHVRESDDRHVILEIIPDGLRTERVLTEEREYIRVVGEGVGLTDETGLPELPVGSVPIGVPFGAIPRLRVLSARWSSPRPGAIVPVPDRYGIRPPFGPSRVVEREPVEGSLYRSRTTHPEAPFELSPVRRLRGLSVVHVIWYAATTEVFARTHRVLERAVLEILFETDGRDGPGLRAARRPERVGRHWERTYRGAVVNATRAVAWARSCPGDGAAVGDTPWGGGTQWKIRVSETGITEIPFSTLNGARFPPGIPVENVSLYQRDFRLDLVDADTVSAPQLFERSDVPIDLRDRNGNGTFDAGDGIVFWGRSVRDQWMTSGWECEDRHDALNAYWVRIDPGGQALRMAVPRPGGSLSGNPADSLDSTPSRIFREEDVQIYARPPDYGPGGRAFENEFYYRNGPTADVDPVDGWWFDDAFTTHDPVPGRPAKLLSRVAGGGLPVDGSYTNRIRFLVNGAQIGADRVFRNFAVTTPGAVLNEHPIPPDLLENGLDANLFRFVGWTYHPITGDPVRVARFFFDWYEITYDRALVARDDRLVLSTAYDSTGNVLVRVRGFTGDQLRLYDVTDADSTRALDVAGSQVIPTGGTWDLRFDHDHDAPGAGGARTFVAVRDEAIPKVPASRVLRVGAPTILAGGQGARYVVVAHDALMGKAREFAALRSKRYTTRSAPVSEVYDVFGNGRIHPDAIKAYTAYAFHRWADPIVFLCLIGDASEDHRGVTANSDPDLVPSHSLFGDYEGAAEGSDQYYAEVTREDSGAFDDLPDLYVGRIAVNTLDELDWNLRRVMEYESHWRGSDPKWRHRVIFMADDAFSGTLSETIGQGAYGWRPGELLFEDTSEYYAEEVTAHPLDSYHARRVYLSEFTHPCADSCYESHSRNCEEDLGIDCGIWYDCRNPANWQAEYFCLRTTLRPLALSRILEYVNDGALIWNFQGHGHRSLMTHEEAFRDDRFSGYRDVDAFRNEGKPLLFVAFACHLGEFDRADEGRNEDCLSEKMMNHRPTGTQEPGGAIACFVSSGFEFLNPNRSFNLYVLQAFFYPEIAADSTELAIGASLPDNSFGGAYGWTLGESTTRARLMFQRRYPLPGQFRRASQRFVLLGDPALEPDAGPPRMKVTVDGNEVEDFRDPYIVSGNHPEPPRYTVAATASDPWGIAAVRIRDTARGEVPVADYEIEGDLTTGDGVRQSLTMIYGIRPRIGETYDVVFVAEDGNGRTAEFVFRVSSRFEFLDDPVAFPNPSRGRVVIGYRLTDRAERVSAEIYTITGRRIAEIDEGVRGDSVLNRLSWNGFDDHGNPVASGTYLIRIRARSVRETIESVVPVVLLR
jgi:hypothetical protein